jgi:hypothetical protein
VKIPYCVVHPDDSDCGRLPAVRISESHCTGADELGSTFTYSRFTCEVILRDYYGREIAHGKLAVYPTTTGTVRWSII